ncbi:hypothetical protein B0T24DRAFT_627820 [Lasiosphaeria ovina]|uniref:Uncharacterized protein n=1 Tax=Lasiosphaeria ovina TaxID=92902 RepID=A0AAE0K6K3_9PEZI|nr:hypothetical protein B0T24DRAFT_627820 [Lasiosphaeria ovina]
MLSQSRSRATEIYGYMDLIQPRNDAVYTYNAAVKLLAELKSEEVVYAKQQAAYGADFIQIDKNLPVGRYYATKLLNDARLSILAELTKGAKSIRYWALTTPEAFNYVLERPYWIWHGLEGPGRGRAGCAQGT